MDRSTGDARGMMTPKEEWLSYSGWNFGTDAWLRDRIAELFDIEQPSDAQGHLLHMASLRLTLQDLPSAAYPTHETELRTLAQAEFGLPPEYPGPDADPSRPDQARRV